jgi:hypothetical protein
VHFGASLGTGVTLPLVGKLVVDRIPDQSVVFRKAEDLISQFDGPEFFSFF